MATLGLTEASPLSESEHQVQLRRAVIASTIGTAIEWYDFFLYSTMTGLVFAKLFFPRSEPLVGTLEAFAVYAVGFVARPVGAAIFGHYGDRIGRKSTLIATLMLMGIATFLVSLVPTYESIGIWGAVILTFLHFVQGIGVGGEWGGSVLMSMEWARGDKHRGFIASWPQFGVPCGLFLANLAVLAFSQMSGEQFLTWGWRVPFFLSLILVARPLRPARHSRNADLQEARRRAEDRAHADAGGDQATAQGDPLERAGANGGAGSVLYLHPLRVFPRNRHAQCLTRLPAFRRADRLGRVVCVDPAVRPHLRPYRAKEDVHAGRGDGWRVRLHLFRHAQYRFAGPDLPRYRAVPDPARHDVRAPGGADRGVLHRAPALQRRVARLSARLGHCRRPGAADRHLAVRPVRFGVRGRVLHPCLRRPDPGRDLHDDGLHGQGHRGRIRVAHGLLERTTAP